MSHIVDFQNVAVTGLSYHQYLHRLQVYVLTNPIYYKNKYNHDFMVTPVAECNNALDYVNKILLKERDIKISSKPLETSDFVVDEIKMTYIFYESGLSVNVMYSLNNPKKRAVGFKLSEGMEVPEELKDKFKFARQKSKLAGTIRGSFFVIKGEY